MPRHARASQTLAADPLWDWWSVAEPALQGYRVFACTAPGFLCDAGHHHDHATIVAGLTHDFRHIAWQSTPILRPSPHRSDNSGLLAGDTMPLATGAVLFYGSRTSQRDDGRTSFITAASSRDGLRWRPEPTCHIAAAAPALTITAPDGEAMLWRDPFTFHHAGRDWMLVAARDARWGPGRRGAIALLSGGPTPFVWRHRGLLFSPGRYATIRRPQAHPSAADPDALLLSFATEHGLHTAPCTIGRHGERVVQDDHLLLPRRRRNEGWFALGDSLGRLLWHVPGAPRPDIARAHLAIRPRVHAWHHARRLATAA